LPDNFLSHNHKLISLIVDEASFFVKKEEVD